MDRWKEEVGRVREEKRRRKKITKRESLRRKKIQVCEKVGKSRNTVFFQWFVAPESGGSKSRLAKVRRVRSHVVRWEMKNCTQLWREARFEVKTYKTPHCRTTLGSWHVEKVHAVVARGTCPSQNVKNTSLSDHFWKLTCQKSARGCGAKRVSKSKCWKHHMFLHFLDVQMSFRVAGARDCAPCPKWAKREGFVAFPKTMAGVGHLKRICKDKFSVAGAVQETCSSELLGGPGAACTISADGCSRQRRFAFHHTTCLPIQHARSPQRVAQGQIKPAFRHTFGCPTRRRGSHFVSYRLAVLPPERNKRTWEARFCMSSDTIWSPGS